MNFHAMTDKGEKREYNEDFVDGFIHENVLFLMAADGQGGGGPGGQSAGKAAIYEARALIEREYKRGMEKHLEWILNHAFYVAHRACEGVRKGDPGRYGGFCASMTVVAVMPTREMVFAHIGNTKFLLDREGNLTQVTTDHTVTQSLLEQRKITPSEAVNHPERAILTRGIGVFPDAKPDIKRGMLARGDILLLVSDGITEHLTLPEIARLVAEAGNIKTACEYLIRGANERGGWDNLSAVVSYIDF